MYISFLRGCLVIDSEGFRLNVGIIVCNDEGQLLWCRRFGKHDAWQFPQGGMNPEETPKDAMYRELKEELGLSSGDVECLAESHDWLSYILPKAFRRYRSKPLCIGQKQKWFLLRLTAEESSVSLDQSDEQEFDQWCWVDYWRPVSEVIEFKRDVYQKALKEFAPILK